MAAEAALAMLTSLLGRPAKSATTVQERDAIDSVRDDDDNSSISLSEFKGGRAAAGLVPSVASGRVGKAASKLMQFSFPSKATPATPGLIGEDVGADDDDDDGGSWYTATPGPENTIGKQPVTALQSRASSVGVQAGSSGGGTGRDGILSVGSGASTVLAEKLLDMRQKAEKWKARCGQLGDQLAALGSSLSAKVGIWDGGCGMEGVEEEKGLHWGKCGRRLRKSIAECPPHLSASRRPRPPSALLPSSAGLRSRLLLTRPRSTGEPSTGSLSICLNTSATSLLSPILRSSGFKLPWPEPRLLAKR